MKSFKDRMAVVAYVAGSLAANEGCTLTMTIKRDESGAFSVTGAIEDSPGSQTTPLDLEPLRRILNELGRRLAGPAGVTMAQINLGEAQRELDRLSR